MNTAPDPARHDEQPKAEGETAAMEVQLGKEAASWAKQRAQQPDCRATVRMRTARQSG